MKRDRWIVPFNGVTTSLFVAALLSTLFATGCTSSSLTSTNPTPAKCQVALNPGTVSVTAAGGTAHMDLAAQQECDWTATSEAAWITNVTPGSGQGNAQLSMQVAPNPQAASRRGNVKAGNITVVVAQDAAPCTYAIGPPSRTVAASGGSTTFDVTTLAGCAWSAASDSSWLRISSNGSGNASGTITVSVAANADIERVGGITVAGQRATVVQPGLVVVPANCTFTLAPPNSDAPAAGGPGSVTVTAAAGCAWTASSNASWISVPQQAQAGIGNGTVPYTVAAPGAHGRPRRMPRGST
jgi:hypothetical protein